MYLFMQSNSSLISSVSVFSPAFPPDCLERALSLPCWVGASCSLEVCDDFIAYLILYNRCYVWIRCWNVGDRLVVRIVDVQIQGDHFLLGLALVSLESFLLSTNTLYLSKSVRFCLLCCLAKDLPRELSANFLATFSLEMIALSLPVLAPLPILRTCLVSWSLLMGITCLWMPSPSMSTLLSLRISTMVASLPSRGPQLILATRPTSTNLLQPQVRQKVPCGICGEIQQYKIIKKHLPLTINTPQATISKYHQGLYYWLQGNQAGPPLEIRQIIIILSGMKEVLMCQAETDTNSPHKHPASTLHPPRMAKNYIIRQSIPHHSNSQLSKTEKQLYSRSILREVIHAHKQKSIKHDINQIHHESVLYAKPIPNFNHDLQFDSIPPNNQQYSSLCSAKIQHISKAFSEHKSKTSMQAPKGMNNTEDPPPTNKTNKVSVSGLVTYKFNSVNAERSIGYNRINHDANMQNDIISFRDKRECSRTRQKLIMLKGSKRKHERYIRTQHSIMGNFKSSTEDYLRELLKEKEEGAMVYNQKARKLKYIKELMQEDQLKYEDAHHIVEQIEDIHAPQREQRKEPPPAQINEEYQINHRRLSMKKRRVYVRYQTFVD